MVLPVWVFAIALILLLVGLAGMVLPVVPGAGLMWIVIAVYAILEGFATIDVLSFIVLSLLAAIGLSADLWMGQVGAHIGGASFWSVVASLVGLILGGLIGLIAGGLGAIPGMLIGAVLGLIANEYREKKDWRAAIKSTWGLVIGFALSNLVKLTAGALMVIIFVWQALRG